jgi:hypothetical protein
MFLALEEAPFVLQGPKPPIPPPAWASHGLLALVALGLLALAVFAVRRFLVRSRQPLAPAAQLELALRLAESQPPAAAVAQATRAFRLYLAAVEPKAAASLSTEELAAVLATLPVFLPARQPLLAALRGADAAKFAGAALAPSALLADLREAARRLEEARRTFARAPVVMVSAGSFGGVIPVTPVAPTAPTEPPPLPGPPPLPRRDLA